MASPASNLSLDDMLKISRAKKEHEKAAQIILGKGRRSSAPTALGTRKDNAGLSLASRVGVTKPAQRSASSRDLKAKAKVPLVRPSPLKQEVITDSSSARPPAISHPTKPQNINIRGLAGPTTVMGSNFAPGTTAADIQSAMEPVGGELQSCRIVSARPTVIAEMVFTDRAGAEAVIETFNNQKADGRLLHIYMKAGPPSHTLATPVRATQSRSPQPARSQPPPASTFTTYREHDDGSNGLAAEPAYQDGSYGFEKPDEAMEVELNTPKEDPPNEQQKPERSGNFDTTAPERREDRSYRPQNHNSYRDDRRYDRRYDRGPWDRRGMYSDRMSYGRSNGRGYM